MAFGIVPANDIVSPPFYMTSEVMDSGFHFSDAAACSNHLRGLPTGQHNEKECFEPVFRGVVVGRRFGVVVER